MAILASEQVNGNKFTPISAGLNNVTVNGASQLLIGSIAVMWPAFSAGQITAISGTVYVSGSASFTVKLQGYKNGTALSTVVTSAVTPSPTPANVSYVVTGTPITFVAGDVLSLYAVTSGSIAGLSVGGFLTVSTF